MISRFTRQLGLFSLTVRCAPIRNFHFSNSKVLTDLVILEKLKINDDWETMLIQGTLSISAIQKSIGNKSKIFLQQSDKLLNYVNEIANDPFAIDKIITKERCSPRSEGPFKNTMDNWRYRLDDLGDQSKLDAYTNIAIENLLFIANKLAHDVHIEAVSPKFEF